MPKKKNQESQEDQSERFRKAVRELEAAGELNPTETDIVFDKMMDKVGIPKARQS
jgi:hypothetical protein